MKDGNGGMLTGLSANAVRVLTYERLLWGGNSDGDVRPMRNIVNKLAASWARMPTTPPTPPVGYRMLEREKAGQHP